MDKLLNYSQRLKAVVSFNTDYTYMLGFFLKLYKPPAPTSPVRLFPRNSFLSGFPCCTLTGIFKFLLKLSCCSSSPHSVTARSRDSSATLMSASLQMTRKARAPGKLRRLRRLRSACDLYTPCNFNCALLSANNSVLV